MPFGAGSQRAGFAPVSCYLTGAAVDCKASGTHAFTWNAAFDNVIDGNALGTLPAGLGLTTPLDGSSNRVTIAAAPGSWLYEFEVTLPTTDATFVADLIPAYGFARTRIGPIAGSAGAPALSSHFYSPADGVGAFSSFAVSTVIAATGVTYSLTPTLVLTRIA